MTGRDHAPSFRSRALRAGAQASIALALAAASAFAAPAVTDSPRATLAAANAAYDAALASPGAKEANLETAVALYERLVREEGVDNGPLRYNLGNAYLLRGDTGRAVLNYRRAARFMPFDADLGANLRIALGRVGSPGTAPAAGPPAPPAEGASGGAAGATDWRDVVHAVPARPLGYAAVGALGAAWLLAAARLLIRAERPAGDHPRDPAAPPRWLAGSAAAIGLVAAGALGADAWAERHEPRGVVLVPTPRGIGPGAPAVAPNGNPTPIPAGAEFTLLYEEPGWRSVRLDAGGEAWLPAGAAELVR